MQIYDGRCHCGEVTFQIKTDLNYSVKCDCSICIRRGATMVRCDQNDLEILSGKESLTLYQFNTEIAQHYFCKHCGIYTFHKMRKIPDKYGVNAGCLEGVNAYELSPSLVNGALR